MLKSDSLLLTVGVLGILALGSVSGVFLKVFVAKRQPHPVFDNVISRVRSWWVMAALVGLALLAGRSGVCMLFAFASFVALRELMGEAEGSRGDRAIRLGGYFLALPVQYLLILVGDDRFLAILVPAYAFLGVPIIAMLAGDASDLPRRAAPLQWGLMLCVLALSYAPALLTLEIPGYAGRNSFLLVFLLLVTQLGDVLQYLWGKLAGSRPLAPGVWAEWFARPAWARLWRGSPRSLGCRRR
jgi:phosphatidate cytidylyltransferase